MSEGREEEHRHEKTDPSRETVRDFDWKALEEAMGESELDLSEADYAKLAVAMNRIVAWVIDGAVNRVPGQKQPDLRSIVRKFLALAWLINPALLGDAKSLAMISQRMGMSRSLFHHHYTAAKKFFRVRTPKNKPADNPTEPPTKTARVDTVTGKITSDDW